MLKTFFSKKTQVAEALLHRLILTQSGIDAICNKLISVATQKDFVYTNILSRELTQDLLLHKRYVPLGLVAMIFESRPDALVQIASLCLKTSNAVLLKGGTEAQKTNTVLFDCIQETTRHFFSQCKKLQQVPDGVRIEDWIQLLKSRSKVQDMLQLSDDIDLIIPVVLTNL